MKFLLPSSVITNKMNAMSKVLNAKPVQPVLDNFLMELDGESLHITASDGECTQCSIIPLTKAEGQGKFCLPTDRMLAALKNLPDQPIAFHIDETTHSVNVKYKNGKYDLMAYNGDDYPQFSPIDDSHGRVQLEAKVLYAGIQQTMVAIGTDELRPMMCGICFTLKENRLEVVATDGHKMIRGRYKTEMQGEPFSFVLPVKAAKIVRGLTNKNDTSQVTITWNGREAIFQFEHDTFRCRLLEGRYPNYNSVIPKEHTRTATIDRTDLLYAMRRVGGFCSTANGCIALDFSGASLNVSGKNIDYSTSAEELLFCSYAGEPLRIGFKSEFFQQMIENLNTQEVIIKMGEASRAAIIEPVADDGDWELLSLLMPMMLNDFE